MKQILFIALAITFLTSCRHHSTKKASAEIFESAFFDADEFVTTLKDATPPPDTAAINQKTPSAAEAMHICYRANGFEPLWFNSKEISPAVANLISDLESLTQDCLNPKDYNTDAIKQGYEKFKTVKTPSIADVVAFDTLCTKSYLKASRDLLLGKIIAARVDSLWFHTNDSSWTGYQYLLAHLSEKDDYPALAIFRSKIPLYDILKKAAAKYTGLSKDTSFTKLKELVAEEPTQLIIDSILNLELDENVYKAGADTENNPLKNFQLFYGLKPTGKKDSITLAYLQRKPEAVIELLAANMERIRWMQQEFEEKYVIVDIPLMEVKLMDGLQEAIRMNVVVGKTIRQTPSLNARMTNIVFNPSWGVPPTILKKDVLPGITAKGARYLSEKNLVPYDHNGNIVNAGSINEKNYKRYTYKQPPGDDNSLGVVKFNLPNKWDIYLHDTPHRDDFQKSYRALSSGCIRLEKPRELAEFLLTTWNDKPQYTLGKIDTLVQTHKTLYEKLTNKLPVHIVYLTAFDDQPDTYRFLRDIYGRDSKLLTALAN